MDTQFPHGDSSWFIHDRFGMFIHWGLYALPARHEWIRHNERISNEDYQKYFDHFSPDLYNPKEWARMAKDAGMKYVVLTSKHHDGFCLWDSQYTEYKVTNTPWGRDLLRPFYDACRDEGLRVGFYYSLIDWHHPDFPVDRLHPQRDDAEFRQQEKNRDVKKYSEYLHNQVGELLRLFDPLDILWLDFSYPGQDGKGRDDWQSDKLIERIRSLQPDILIDNRLNLPGSEDFQTPEQYVPAGVITDSNGNPVVWEGCQTFSGSWGYHRDEASWKSVPMLIQMLIDHVSMQGNLLLNVGPTGRGTFDLRAHERLEGIGHWMKYNSRSIYGCTAAPADIPVPQNCRFTFNPQTKRLYLHMYAWPFKSLHLPELAGKISYAQLLHDASEVKMYCSTSEVDHINDSAVQAVHGKNCLTLELPILKPNVEVPVIELFLES